jgi:hypothetical protein
MQVSTDLVPPGNEGKTGSPMWMWAVIGALILAVIVAGAIVVMKNNSKDDGFV